MARSIERLEKLTLPAIIMRGIVAFPEINVSLGFEISKGISAKAVEHAQNNNNSLVLLVTQARTDNADSPKPDDMYKVGTVAKVKQMIKLPDGNSRVLVEGISRAEIISWDSSKEFFICDVMQKSIHLADNGGIKGEAAISETLKVFERYSRFIPRISSELMFTVHSIKNPGLLADFIASSIYFNLDKKQKLLEQFDPLKRLELLCVILEKEIEMLEVEEQIHKKVRGQIEHNQRDYFLREQLKALQHELGEGNDVEFENEIAEYRDKIEGMNLPEEVYERLTKELTRLQKTPGASPESTVIRNYLDMCLELPWDKKTKDRLDIKIAEKILNEDHDGLEKVKERILEFIAVKQLEPELRGQILCLVGPPGVGKTSIAASIARALKRKYVRVSLGGVRDEADIRGHRKTYIGSMPGRIINGVKQAGSLNPLILLDEVDKLTHYSHGDPASALLEVLDSEQNKAFRDHYIEVPIDLSDCLFIATANTMDTIPRPLIDRMEIIQITSYTRNEKHRIAKNHLIGKQAKKHGMNKKTFKINDEALFDMIDYYTREAGVRNLEREIANLCRKSVKKLLTEEKKSISINKDLLFELLGNPKYKNDAYSIEDEVGVVNGLAWTAMGGEILQVEVVIVEGNGKIELTGSLGEVMKESARAAISFLRTIVKKYNVNEDFYKTKDIHIHFPEGAIPKDGPSAGITIATAIFSQLTGYPVRSSVAMTGEITLRGKVLPIGGLKEKTVAAYKSKIKTVVIPEQNVPDLDDIDKEVKESLHFVSAKNIEKVFETAIIFPEKPLICGDAVLDVGIADNNSLLTTTIVPDPDVPAVRKNTSY